MAMADAAGHPGTCQLAFLVEGEASLFEIGPTGWADTQPHQRAIWRNYLR
jgi:hypothetical protein